MSGFNQKQNMVAGVSERPVRPATSFSTPGKLEPPRRRSKAPFLVAGLVVAALVAGVAFWFMRPEPKGVENTPMSVKNIGNTTATIVWNSDKPLTSQVKYGKTTEYGLLSAFNATPVTSHSVTLTGLTPATTYNYMAMSTDSTGQVIPSGNATFTTTGSHDASAIGSVTATGVTGTAATITWTTDQPSTSQVEYGDTPAYGSLSAFTPAPVTAHSVTLTALKPGITYNYAALSTSASGKITTSPNATFTTSATAGAPTVSNVKAVSVTPNSATITWNTDQPSASQVAYGTTPAYGFLSVFSAASVTAHTLILTGLTPATTYDFAALSTSSTGQVGKSEGGSFTTPGAAGTPIISNAKVTGGAGSSATITWTTDQPSASQVQFGTTTDYGMLSAFNSSMVTSHSVTVNSLTPGAAYNFSALSTSATGQTGKSANLTLTAAAGPPVIQQIAASGISGDTATITWSTDQPSTSQVKYCSTTIFYFLTHRHRKPYDLQSQADDKLVKVHSVTLKGLTSGTTYNYSVVSTNAGGIQNLSPNLKFSTAR
jgi:hypothetical protein